MGPALVTCTFIVGGGLTVLFGLGMNVESMPPARATQGSGKEDWVTVWFWDMKLNWIMSPTAASTELGEYTSPALPPTVT